MFRFPAFCLLAIAISLQAPTSAARAQQAAASPRDRRLFDFDWRFKPGDVTGAEAQAFDDAAWEKIDLPHDFMIEGKGQAIVPPGGRATGAGRASTLPADPEGPFDPRSPGGNSIGYLNGGFGWYRKTFTMPDSSRNRRVFVEFEGVYMNSEVWINGQSLGVRPYGYSTFEYDLTPHLRFGRDTNVLAVRVNVQQPSSRWYSGAGIYRHVWLTDNRAAARRALGHDRSARRPLPMRWQRSRFGRLSRMTEHRPPSSSSLLLHFSTETGANDPCGTRREDRNKPSLPAAETDCHDVFTTSLAHIAGPSTIPICYTAVTRVYSGSSQHALRRSPHRLRHSHD